MSNIARLKDAEISNGNLIDADDLDAEFDQIISAYNTNDTELTAIGTGAYTFSGVKTFSSTPLMNAISERTAGSGVTIDSVRLKDGMVMVAGTPASGGEIGYASNRLTYHNGTSVITLPNGDAVQAVSVISDDPSAGASNRGTLYVCTGTFTFSIAAATSLGSLWYIYIRNEGTGLVTVDPNASETVDLLTTFPIYPGETVMITRIGSSTFRTFGRTPPGTWILAETLSPSGVASVDSTFGFASGYDHKWEITELDMASDAVGFDMRVSIDGSTFRSTAGDYGWSVGALNNLSVQPTGSTSDTEISIANSANTETDLGDAAGEPPHMFVIEGFGLDNNGSARKYFLVDGFTFSSSGRAGRIAGTGFYDGTTDDILGVRFLSTANFTATIKHYVKRR